MEQLKNLYWIGISFLYFVGVLPITAEEDQSLTITSETDDYSADFYIKGTDPKTDKERTTIGQGELVTITLTGKNVDDTTSAKWLASGSGGSLEESGGTSATLKASKIETGGVTIHAEANGKRSKELTFNVISPEDAEGQKEKDNPIPSGKIGVDVLMNVTVHPTNVSFSNLSVVEEDHGTVPAPDSLPFPFPDHESNPEAVSLSALNQFQDNVAAVLPAADLYLLPNGTVQWDWICKFRTTGVDDFFKVTNQTFSLIRDRKLGLPPSDKISIKVKKFDVEFSSESKFN